MTYTRGFLWTITTNTHACLLRTLTHNRTNTYRHDDAIRMSAINPAALTAASLSGGGWGRTRAPFVLCPTHRQSQWPRIHTPWYGVFLATYQASLSPVSGAAKDVVLSDSSPTPSSSGEPASALAASAADTLAASCPRRRTSPIWSEVVSMVSTWRGRKEERKVSV